MNICNWVNSRKKNVDYSEEITEANHDEMENVLWDRFTDMMPKGVLCDDLAGVCVYFMGRDPIAFYDYENAVGYINKRAVKSFA
jgi:hypothetical protein